MPFSDFQHKFSLTAAPVGLRQDVARTLGEVLGAWRLVYRSYLAAGLIQSNEQEIYSCPQAITPNAAVILGTIGPLTVTTLTAIVDKGQGLPIDQVYGAELEGLRKAGHTFMQVGLFADRRQLLSRCDEALLDLMRMAFYYGFHSGASDIVVGVSPEHAPFYNRAFSLEYLGTPKSYAMLNHTPVVMLRGNLQAKLINQPLSPALAYFMDNPIEPEAFDGRFDFAKESMARSPLAEALDQTRPGSLSMRIA